MNTTADLLAELEDLGAIGDKDFVVALPAAVETMGAEVEEIEDEVFEDSDSEIPVLDDKGYKVVALTDLVIEEFDRMISSMSTVRDAVKALRKELIVTNTVVEKVVVPGARREVPPPSLTDDYNAQGDPDNWGNISLTIPPSVPLPYED